MESAQPANTVGSRERTAQPRGSRFWTVVNLLLCGGVALVSFRYLLGVGPVPELIAQNLFKPFWLVAHVAGAATALLVSPLQLMGALRRGAPRLHRWLGRVYVVGCTLGGVAGLPLALGSAAGPVATAGFGLLALAWLYTTLRGFRAGFRRQLAEHRAWMIRSFGLTYAAVTLRIYLAILPALPVAFIDGYRAIAFLCWLPNLLGVELLLRRSRPQPATALRAQPA
jgi:hypothetical protein